MRKAPHASYNGVDLHTLADQRGLFWIGGPAGAYDHARRFLQFTPDELRRVSLDRAYPQLQSMREGGAAFLFRPLSDDFSGRAHWREVHQIAAHRKWQVFDAEEFLETIDGRHRPYIGFDMASGYDASAFELLDAPLSRERLIAALARGMAAKHFNAPPALPKSRVDKYITPEIAERLKRLSGEIPQSTNAAGAASYPQAPPAVSVTTSNLNCNKPKRGAKNEK